MQLMQTFLILLASALSYTQTTPDTIDSVNIIRKLTQDLHSSPSGYIFHHRSDSVHPGGYKADVNHGKAKIADQLEPENSHGKGGIYRVARGYGFMISHDYGSQGSHVEAPRTDSHLGATNADLASIAVLQLGSKNSGGPIIDVHEKSRSVWPGKRKGLESYIDEEMYGSYAEYDKLVKDGKEEPSDSPGEYYGSDVNDGKEKYDSDDGYEESNNARDKGRYLESEKYDGSENYSEGGNYGALGETGDYSEDGETEKYLTPGEYGGSDDDNAKGRVRLFDEYGASEYNHGKSEPFERNDEFVNHYRNYEGPSMHGEYEGYNREPRFEDVKNSILADFFKEYEHFSHGPNIQTGFKNDYEFDDEYYGHHDSEDKSSHYAENDKSGEDFFDEADFKGDHHEEGDGKIESNFGEKKGHKSGSKTTGYRNMLHKDEYTKDHTFYEHAKNNGHFDKTGDCDEHDSQNEGSHKTSGHHDSSSEDDHHGKTDSDDKGYDFNDDISHHHEHGFKSYFDDYSDYTNGGDDQYGLEYGDSYDHSDSEPKY